MESLLEPSKLKEIFRGIENMGGIQQYADRIRLLHHRYLETRLLGEQLLPSIESDELIRFVEDADYLATQYTNPLFTGKKAGLPLAELPSRQIVQDALTLAGTIYEFLADIAKSYESHSESPPPFSRDADFLRSGLFEPHDFGSVLGSSTLLSIKSSLCYGLGMFESRIQVILGRILEATAKPVGSLTLDNLSQWADYLLLSLLSRRLNGGALIDATKAISQSTSQIRSQLRKGMGEGIQIPPQAVAKAEIQLSLIDGVLNCAEAFEWGDESRFQLSLENFKKSVESAYILRDYELVWMHRTLSNVLSRMWADSPWQRLSGVIPHPQYLRDLVSEGVVTLWTSQIAALEMQSSLGELDGGYLDERIKRAVIHMPTSAGKTLLAELAIARQVFSDKSCQCVYVAPSRALCDQISNDLSRRLGPFGVGVTAIVSDNEVSGYESLLLRKTNVIVITPEKLTHLFRQKSATVHNAKLFIFDELQTISKKGRGWVFEEIISLLIQHPQTKAAKMLFLSAVMPNHLDIQEWVDNEKLNDTVSEPWQPTRVLKGVINFVERGKASLGDNELVGNLIYVRNAVELASPLRIENFLSSNQVLQWEKKNKDGSQKFRLKRDVTRSDDSITHAVVASKRFARLGSVLVYCPKQAQATKFCQIAGESRIEADFPELREEQEEDFRELLDFITGRLPVSHPLVNAIRHRVAYHHSGLPKDVRNEVEGAFRRGIIHVLSATSTLLEGVNFPVKTLLLSDYSTSRRYDFQKREWLRSNQLSQSDFRNVAGRAGRAFYETEGQVVFIQSVDNYPHSPSRIPFDDSFRDYLQTRGDSQTLEIKSAFESYVSQGILEHLGDLVEQVDNGSLSDEDLLFAERDPLGTDTSTVVKSLQSFTLLLQDQGLAGNEEESFVKIFQGTFFGKSHPEQATPVGRFCHRSGRAIKTRINDDFRALFAQTGLNIPTCRLLLSRVEAFWSERIQIAGLFESPLDERFLADVAGVVYDLGDTTLASRPVTLAREGKGVRTKRDIEDEKALFSEWIIRHDLESLMTKHLGFIVDESWRAEQFVSYTQNTLVFQIPWVLSAFWLFSKVVLEKHRITELASTPLGRELLLLPSYAKFGVNTPAAAFFSSLGINPASLARQLGDLYEKEETERFDYVRMLGWLHGVDLTMLDVGGHILPRSYIRRLSHLLVGIRPLENAVFSATSWEMQFFIAGWGYHEGEKHIDTLRSGDEVLLRREPGNKYDRNAVRLVSNNGLTLGYVPRHLSRDIALRMGRLKAVVEEVLPTSPAYQRVKVRCFTEENA